MVIDELLCAVFDHYRPFFLSECPRVLRTTSGDVALTNYACRVPHIEHLYMCNSSRRAFLLGTRVRLRWKLLLKQGLRLPAGTNIVGRCVVLAAWWALLAVTRGVTAGRPLRIVLLPIDLQCVVHVKNVLGCFSFVGWVPSVSEFFREVLGFD